MVLTYDEHGNPDVKVVKSGEKTAQSIVLRKIIDNWSETVEDATHGELKTPKNRTYIYGMKKSSIEQYLNQWYWFGDEAPNDAWYMMLACMAAVCVAAWIFAQSETLKIGDGKIFRQPFEVVFVVASITLGILDDKLNWIITREEGLPQPMDFAIWVGVFAVTYWVTTCISAVQKIGLRKYVTERTLVWRLWKALREEAPAAAERVGRDGGRLYRKVKKLANRVNPSNPVKKFSFMGIEKRENREILQEYMKYCLGVTHLAMSGIQAEFYRILAFAMWMEKETAMELKLASETEIKKYFQTIELKEASYFNDIVIAIYQLYEYLQTKEIIDRIPFRYEYYLKKEIHCHNNRSVEMEIYERILRELKNFPEIPRLILLHSMLIGLRISEVCTLKGDAYSWQGRDAWIQVYQMKMRTYKRVPIPDVLYKIMKRYLEKYHIGSEDYVFQNKRGGAYQYGSFKWQMKELFNKRQDIFKG